LLSGVFDPTIATILSLINQKLTIKKIKMKKVLLKVTSVLLISAGFIACQKEKQEDPPAQEVVTTLNQGNGVMETVQRGPNGGNVVFSNWIQKTDPDWFIWNPGKFTTDILTTSLTDAVRDKV
jgi:hypothetical protein